MFQTTSKSVKELSILDDEELIRTAQQGDGTAFTLLYERHLPAVFNRVRYRIPERDVEDVTQEVFIAAMRSIKSFRGTAQFSTWLRTLTNRRIADYYRSRNDAEAELAVPLSEASPGYVPNLRTSDTTHHTDDQIILQDALLQLPEHYQEIILLRFAEGLKFKEIAQTMGQSLEATKSLFRRAMSALRDELGENNV